MQFDIMTETCIIIQTCIIIHVSGMMTKLNSNEYYKNQNKTSLFPLLFSFVSKIKINIVLCIVMISCWQYLITHGVMVRVFAQKSRGCEFDSTWSQTFWYSVNWKKS